jgi:hypothetical protein
MVMPDGTSTVSAIWDFFSTGRRLATIGVAAVDRDLLERLHQLARALEI